MRTYVVTGDSLTFQADDEEHAIEQYLDALRGGGYVRAALAAHTIRTESGVRVNPLTHDTYNTLRDIRGDVSLALAGHTPVSAETLDAIDGVMDVVHDALPEHSHDEDGYD